MDAKTQKRIRFAIYARISSEMQNDISLDAQIERCTKAIAEKGGAVVKVYRDEAKNGWSLDREGFIEMRRHAEKGRFDAIMFWKFDRLARNHDHVVMIKMLLRHEYGLKLYCVEGFSEDDDDSAYAAMMEQLLAVFSAFYSKNLSNETKRGKLYRAQRGFFNGSIPPLGYDFVRKENATDDRPEGLHINPEIAPLVVQAFELYASGDYSDKTLALWLNQHAIIQQIRKGKKPVGKEMMRDLLKNKVYTGRVPYSETIYSGSLGQGKRSARNRKTWFEGQHEPLISDELYEECQDVRSSRVRSHSPRIFARTYLVGDKVYCARCITSKSPNLADENYGKMRAKWDNRMGDGYYSCMAVDRGYKKCGQLGILVSLVDSQVVEALTKLHIPMGYRERVERAVREKVEHEEAIKRMDELMEIVQRIDFRFENGFISSAEYVERRQQLQREIEALKPIDYDDLTEAADLLGNFTQYWDACADTQNPQEARRQLLDKIIDRVFVYDNRVIAIALHGNYNVILDEGVTLPSDFSQALQGKDVDDEGAEGGIKNGNITKNVSIYCGSDGIRTRDLHLDRVAC